MVEKQKSRRRRKKDENLKCKKVEKKKYIKVKR